MLDQNNSVYVVSLGCAKNLVDSEVMLGKLVESGFKIVDSPKNASVIIVNTCGFINDAKMESVNVILEMADWKASDQTLCHKLIVTGCLAQRYVDELLVEIPEVDAFVGTGEYHKIIDIIKSSNSENKNFVEVPEFIHSDNDHRIISTPSYYAWLKIAEGCDRHCSFCVIPQLRGRYRSRTVESLLVEARNLVAHGVRELNLISQDLSFYGRDLGENNDLSKLVTGLEEIEDLNWIRLLYYYPDDLNEKFIQMMKNSTKICHYLDMPIQHFSSSVLKKMNRKITGEEVLKKIRMLRNEIPDIFLRTSLIVGFPGETENDFQQLLDGISEARFNHVGIFPYSDEENTRASQLSSKVAEDVIQERLEKAYTLQKKIAHDLNMDMVGKTLEVLVEGLHDETELLIQGRHRGQAPDVDGKVIINENLSGIKLEIGDLVSVQVSECFEYDLIASVIS